jgi:hypothetical protein
MSSEHYIERSNLSHAWADAMRTVIRHRGEMAPLVVSVTGFNDQGQPQEDQVLRAALDLTLNETGLQNCETVANTIFPNSLWNPALPASKLFERYKVILPKLGKAERANQYGLYFERLTSGGPPGSENQLDFVLKTFTGRNGVRRSALQVAVFDPARDHSAAAQRGFPCLQHVTFAPTDGGLCINGFYATQYVLERAYGNYLGLCRLGRFVAHELKIPLTRLTCFTGIMLKDAAASRGNLARVNAAIDAALAETRE